MHISLRKNKTKYLTMRTFLFLAMIIILSASYAFSAGMSDEAAIQLIKRTDNNIAPQQYESYMTLKNYYPDRKMLENKAHFYRKGNKMAAIFIDPPRQKGQAFIRDGDNMWMYLPRSKKILRIGAKENSMGGEASNADMMRIDLSKDYNGTYLYDEEIDGIICYKLELKAKNRTVAYNKIHYWISKEKELPVKREFFSLSGNTLKTMYFKDIKIIGGQERPSFCVIINEKNKAYKTEMIIEQMNHEILIEDHIFNPAYIKRKALR